MASTLTSAQLYVLLMKPPLPIGILLNLFPWEKLQGGKELWSPVMALALISRYSAGNWSGATAQSNELFTHDVQVCIPFLMLCIGLDPKSDISLLSSIIAEHGINSRGSKEGDQDTRLSAGQVNGTSGQSGRLLAALFTGSGGGGSGHLSGTTPSLKMLLTGCHAIMQFTSSDPDPVPSSLIQTGEA